MKKPKAKSNKAAILYLLLALSGLSVSLYWARGLHLNRLAAIRTEAERFEAKVSALQAAIDQEGGDLAGALATEEARLAEAKGVTLNRVDTNQVVQAIAGLAQETGVTVTSYGIGETTQDRASLIYVTPVSLSVEALEGAWLATFLSSLQDRLAGARVSAQSVPYTRREGEDLLRLSLTLNLFSYEGAIVP